MELTENIKQIIKDNNLRIEGGAIVGFESYSQLIDLFPDYKAHKFCRRQGETFYRDLGSIWEDIYVAEFYLNLLHDYKVYTKMSYSELFKQEILIYDDVEYEKDELLIIIDRMYYIWDVMKDIKDDEIVIQDLYSHSNVFSMKKHVMELRYDTYEYAIGIKI